MPKTLDKNIPIVTDSWCTVPNAPRYLYGAVSDSTIGPTQLTRPEHNHHHRHHQHGCSGQLLTTEFRDWNVHEVQCQRVFRSSTL